MEIKNFEEACYGEKCNIFDIINQTIEPIELVKEKEKNEINLKGTEHNIMIKNFKSLVKEEACDSEEIKIRTPDTNTVLDEGVMNVKKSIYLRDVIFDMNVISNELAGVAVSILTKILKESRKKIKFVETEETAEEDKILYDRIWAFLSDCQRIIHLRESEMIHGLILLEKVYEKHGNGNDFHSNFVDLIFYLVTCIILAHKYSTDTPITNEEWCNIGNLSTQTINACEAHTLWLLKYELWINEKDVKDFIKGHEYKTKTDIMKMMK
jgi:hypothetical protein